MASDAEKALALLRGRRFTEYDAWLRAEHQRHQNEGGVLRIPEMLQAAGSQLLSIDRLTQEWLERAPQSYGALLARATFLEARGRAARGSGTADTVHGQHWAAIAQAFSQAYALYAQAAEQIEQPGYALSRLGHMRVVAGPAIAGAHAFPDGLDWYDYGLQREPASLELRSSKLLSLRPEWGGSTQAFEAYLQDPVHQALRPGDWQRLCRQACAARANHLYFFRDDAEAAMAELDAGIAHDPDNPWGYYWRGYINAARDPALAVPDYARAVAIEPHDAVLLDAYVQTLWKLDRHDTQLEPLLTQLLSLGVASAFHDLARHLFWNLKQPQRALSIWAQGADEGIAQCSFELAQRYRKGIADVWPADPHKALGYFRRAAEQGEPAAYLEIYLLGQQPNAGLSPEEGARALLQAAAQPDGAQAHAYLASAIFRPEEALRYDDTGKLWFATGTPLQPGTPEAGQYITHLRTAAQGGDSWAVLRLAECLRHGDFVAQSPAQAAEWLQHLIATRDADDGDRHRALYILGDMVLHGEAPGGHETALTLLAEAGEAGHHQAIETLVAFYGRGWKRAAISPQPEQARVWAERAKAAGARLPGDIEQLLEPKNFSHSLLTSVVQTLVLGPLSTVWTLLVTLFGKRRLGRLVLWLLGGLVAFVLVAILHRGLTGGASTPERPLQAPTAQADPERSR